MKFHLPVLMLIGLMACEPGTNHAIQPVVAGFKTIHATDSNRTYKPGVPESDYLHYRPLDMDLWYPAIPEPKDSAMQFSQILGLLDQRANYYTDSKMGDGLSQQLAAYFCKGIGCSDSSQLLRFRSSSFKMAKPVAGKFPLVIYFAAYNGMSYENFTLFEALAQKGFIVLSINSIGRYPGDMTMKNQDLMEQVNDAVASLKYLRTDPSIDFSRIGLIGYSWGGLSAALFAGRIPGVSCLVSLDGSEFHKYADSKEENADFDSTRYMREFVSLQIKQPYLRLESSSTAIIDSVFNFKSRLSGKATITLINGAKHEDFSCLSYIVPLAGNCQDSGYYTRVLNITTEFLDHELVDHK